MIRLSSSLLFLTLATTASAEVHSLQAWSHRAGERGQVEVRLEGDAFERFALFSTVGGSSALDLSTATRVAFGQFDAFGNARVVAAAPMASAMPQNFGVQLWAVTRSAAGFDSASVLLPLQGNGGTLCQDFEPDYKLGSIEPVAGELVSDQWSRVSMAVSATNNFAGHPDAAVIFDSANPTGGDDDLRTPGSGFGNTEALGQLIVIAENDIDANGDGLVDEPDDEEAGGVIRFDFSEPYRMCSATLVDIDDAAASELRFYIGTSMTLETIPLVNSGDNSVQTITFDKRDVRAFEVVLGGSGGIAHLGMVPCPMTFNLDETPFGRPLNISAGEWVENDYAFLGLTVSTTNAVAGHPDKAILFDSENPTGGDFDLQTPGPGINNTEPLGLVLIIAENDVDANGDGLVDDPDDEEGGGQIVLEFSEAITFFRTSVLDVDGMELDNFLLEDENGNTLDLVDIGSLGDNSVQTLETAAPVSGIHRITVNLTGSGALARLRWCVDSSTQQVGGGQ